MMYYRISKYNPIDRIDGIYQVDDWTSYSDIGEQHGGRVVQPSEYLAVETQYISCIQDIWVHAMCTMYVFQDLKSHLTDYLGKMVSLWAGVKHHSF